MKDENSKYFLERDHSYQLSLLAIKNEDWIQGLYYIDRDLKNMQFGSSSKAQHHLVQKIMKNFECRQFLGIINKIGFEGEESTKAKVIASIEDWITRTPNIVYDPLNIWDDIMTSRTMYLDAYEKHIKNVKEDISMHKKLSDIRSLLYLQAAHGAKEMALYDSSEKYLKHAVDVCNDLGPCIPLIVDLKIKQYKTKYLNEDMDENITRLKKIEEVIKRHKHESESEHQLSLGKLALLLADIKQLVMEVVLDNHDDDENVHNEHYTDALKKTFKIYETIITKAETKKVDDEVLTEANMKFALF